MFISASVVLYNNDKNKLSKLIYSLNQAELINVVYIFDNSKDKKLEFIGEHPEHAPEPGRKTPQKDLIDEDAIDESGNLIHDKSKDEADAK